MILTPDHPLFQGWTPLPFQSLLPSLELHGLAMSDPQILSGSEHGFVDRSGATGMEQYVAMLGFESVVEGVRSAIAQVGATVGYLKKAVSTLDKIYTGSLAEIGGALDIVDGVLLGNLLFEVGMDLIAWVPFVGWAIQIVTQVAKIVQGIIRFLDGKREEEAIRALSEVATIPHAKWSKDADSQGAQQIISAAAGYNVEWIVRPRYLAPNGLASDVTGTHVEKHGSDDRWSAWLLLTGRSPSNPYVGGLGFLPGTRNLHGSMELSTRGPGGSWILDIGDFYPTAKQMATSLWEQMVKGHPLAMGVNTDRVADEWAAYLHAILDFALPTDQGGSGIMPRGWSLSETAYEVGDTTNVCRYHGQRGCSARDVNQTKTKDIPGTGHSSAFVAYFKALFDYKSPTGVWSLPNIDVHDTRPGLALRQLKQVQESMLQSMECMYFDDSRVPMAGGVTGARFAAIGTPGNPGPMFDMWERNVQSVFDSGDWRNVRWEDVPVHPPGGDRNRVRENLELATMNQYGKTAEEFFESRGMRLEVNGGGSSGLPPSAIPPPAPAAPVEVATISYVDLVDANGTKRKKKAKSSAVGAAVVLALGVGALALKK